MYPDKKHIAEVILNIPQKRAQKKLMGFLYPKEIMKAFNAVDLKKRGGEGFYHPSSSL
jgi:NADH:ubiquinone oxidoreductase subunit F (NADH-binding)